MSQTKPWLVGAERHARISVTATIRRFMEDKVKEQVEIWTKIDPILTLELIKSKLAEVSDELARLRAITKNPTGTQDKK